MKADVREATLPQLISRYRAATSGLADHAFYVRALHSYHSTSTEGCSLTLQQTQLLLGNNQLFPDLSIPDQWLTIDHHNTLTKILAMADAHEPINRPAIQQLASVLMQQTGGLIHSLLSSFDTRKGELRIDSSMSGRRLLIDAHKLPLALDALCKDINTTISQLKTPRQIYELSFNAHLKLLTLHPFGAGNGLMARLLMNYVQQYHQLPLCPVYADSRGAYTRALDTSWRQKTSLPIVSFMHSQLRRFLQEGME